MKFFLILTIVSLAMLSAVNAFPHLPQRKENKTVFVECSNPFAPPTPFLNVKIKPDPIESEKFVKFEVSGKLEKDITSDYKLQFAFYDTNGYDIADPTVVEICDKLKCPFKAGENFELKQKVKAPKLPDNYDFTVEILTQPKDPKTQIDIIGCAIGVIN